jgi:hypothetical protein
MHSFAKKVAQVLMGGSRVLRGVAKKTPVMKRDDAAAWSQGACQTTRELLKGMRC